MRTLAHNLRVEGHTSRAECVIELILEIERLMSCLCRTEMKLSGEKNLTAANMVSVREDIKKCLSTDVRDELDIMLNTYELKLSDFTCHTCPAKKECDYAWDPTNLGEKCLKTM